MLFKGELDLILGGLNSGVYFYFYLNSQIWMLSNSLDQSLDTSKDTILLYNAYVNSNSWEAYAKSTFFSHWGSFK